VFTFGAHSPWEEDYAKTLNEAGFTADATGIKSALLAAFRDNSSALLFAAMYLCVETKTFPTYAELIYDALSEHPDDDFKRNLSLTVLKYLVTHAGEKDGRYILPGYRAALHELFSADAVSMHEITAYKLLLIIAYSHPLDMYKYATRFLLHSEKREFYPAAEDLTCKDIVERWWNAITPEVAFLIYSSRKGKPVFSSYEAQFKAKAAPYLDGTATPAPDLRERVVAQLDAEIAKDEKLLAEMVQKEEAAKAVPAKQANWETAPK
jgi:hypothetical protein